MISLDEAINEMANRAFWKNEPELIGVYLANPTRTGALRQNLCSPVSHRIREKLLIEVKGARSEGRFPFAVENAPALHRMERQVLRQICERSARLSSLSNS
jgi:hypothetical protein